MAEGGGPPDDDTEAAPPSKDILNLRTKVEPSGRNGHRTTSADEVKIRGGRAK